jgi:FlaA1/EpsC-like NDP-sugar epimerase
MIHKFFLKKHAPRWLILLIDICICFFSIISAYLLRFNFNIPPETLDNSNFDSLFYVVPFVLLVRLISFLISNSYSGIIRYTSTKDASRIFVVLISGSIIFGIGNIISYQIKTLYFIPITIIGIDFLANMFFMTSLRFFIKTIYLEYSYGRLETNNAIIFGISELAIITRRTLSKDMDAKYKIVAFIDHSNTVVGKKIDGIGVFKPTDLKKIIEKFDVKVIILAEKQFPKELKNEVVDICLQSNINILTLPNVSRWIKGELSTNQIKQFRIEDLLERDPIKLDEEEIRNYTRNKTILVTGAAGSIGSEIVKQLLCFEPNKIIIFDQAESPLYDLELELSEKYNFNNFEIVIGDVTNPLRLKSVFKSFKPQVVFHAAAYKHVPMMENSPSESIITNVYGTKLLADLSVEYGVIKFVMISTDKAVKPTNIMGATKRLAEMYVQSLNELGKTQFITTRFGNVLGSNGSVINRFKDQIKKGGPVTVTHPEITRYFMTIPEACQLVLEAGAMGKGGEIFIFDMGKSVKIVKLAEKMIQLSGLNNSKEIEIKFTGLRPGEKLYEELLNDKENTIPTYHPQIMIGKIKKCPLKEVEKGIDELIKLAKQDDNFAMVEKMKIMIEDFKSHNSVYEQIDKKLNQIQVIK